MQGPSAGRRCGLQSRLQAALHFAFFSHGSGMRYNYSSVKEGESGMPSIEAMRFNRILAMASAPKSVVDIDFAAEREKNRRRRLPKCPEGMKVESADFSGLHAEVITNTTDKARKDTVIWYIHGGGFTTGAARERRQITQYLCGSYGYTVVANDYRLAPENIMPAGFDDCVLFYKELVNRAGAGHILVMGESCGGTLALSVSLEAKRENIPLPCGIAAFSPCVNQAYRYPSHLGNAGTDYMLHDSVNSEGQYEVEFGTKHPDPEVLHSIYASPIFGDYKGLPPIFLSATDTEALYDDSVELCRKLKVGNHPCELEIKKNVFHAYPMFPIIPEARETIADMFAFFYRQGVLEWP